MTCCSCGSCCCCCGGDNDVHSKGTDDRETLNPLEHRRCHDVLWILVFIAAIAGAIYVTSTAISEGNLKNLEYGISSNDTLCGSGDEANNPKLVFCFGSPSLSLSSVFKVCAPKCPQNNTDVINLYEAKKDEFLLYTAFTSTEWETSNYLLVRSLCVAPAVSVFNRCLYDFSVTNVTQLGLSYLETSQSNDPGDSSLSGGSQMLLNSFSDVAVSWYAILITGIVGGLIFSFVWLFLLKYFAGLIVWSTILLFFACIIALDVLIASKAGMTTNITQTKPTGQGTDPQPTPTMQQQYEKYYRVLFWIFIGITGAFVMLLMFMFHRIELAIALVKESADVIKKIPQLLLTPILPTIAMGFVFMYGTFITAMLASTGTFKNGHLSWNKHIRYLMLYHIFFVLWLMFLFSAIHSVVMAGAVATYYWTRDKGSISSPIRKTIYRTLRYHLGSCIFGSFILALVKMLVWFLRYMTAKLKKYAGSGNWIARFMICCFNCCLWCFEKFIKYLTKNAYIMIAVDGSSFCRSAITSFKIVMDNVLRMTTVNFVTRFVFFLAKIGVACGCGLGCTVWIEYYWVYSPGSTTISSPFVPSVCCAILGYFVAYLFFEVVDFTIDTLLFCFCLDDTRNSQTGDYFASARLIKFMANAPKMSHHEFPN